MPKVLLLIIAAIFALAVAPSAYGFKVLFVGNSFTGYSVSTLQRFAKNNPQGADTFAYEFVGGISLSEHARRAQTLNRIRDGKWDYVVLQDHSTRPIRNSAAFVSAIEFLVTKVRASGAEPILFMTWARLQSGNYPGDQSTVSRAYLDIGKRLNVSVARVGDLWFDMYQNNRNLFNRMFDPDGIHPTSFGTFAVAVSIYHILYDDDLSWIPTSGVGSASKVLHAASARLNRPRPPHFNPANLSSSNSLLRISPVLTILL